MTRSNKWYVGAVTAIVFAVAIGTQLAAPAHADDPAGKKPLPGLPGENAVSKAGRMTVARMEEELAAAGKSVDKKALADIFNRNTASDFTIMGGDGLADKDAFLQLVQWDDSDDKSEGFEMHDMKTRMFGGAAIQTGRFTDRNRSTNNSRLYTAMWTHREGSWLIVHMHISESSAP
jgi:hypothetical protein